MEERRPWEGWLEGDVPEEELAAGEAAIEAAAEKARQAAAQRETAPEAGNGVGASPGRTEETPHVRAATRTDPILPTVQSVREHPARAAGRLAFGGLVEGREDLPAVGQLPLFATARGPRVPILELADVRGGPIMAQGRGAPLDLRLFVGASLMTPFADRSGRTTLAVSVRELRDFLFPNGWQRGRDWPRVQAALGRMHNHRIPGPFPLHDWGVVRDWLPVALRGGATEDADLDDLVVLDVPTPARRRQRPGDLPPRARAARRRLRAALPGYIAAHSVAWRLGISRRRHPRNRSVHLWSANPAHYPVLTAADRDRLAFGRVKRARKEGRRSADAHWEELPGVEILSRTATTQDGQKGWVIVPEAAAAAIRSRES